MEALLDFLGDDAEQDADFLLVLRDRLSTLYCHRERLLSEYSRISRTGPAYQTQLLLNQLMTTTSAMESTRREIIDRAKHLRMFRRYGTGNNRHSGW